MSEGLSQVTFDILDAQIKHAGTRAAFLRAVYGMREIGDFELRPNINGSKKSLSFATGGVSYFAFIANETWLLWYFRAPGFRDGIFTWEQLRTAFGNLEPSDRTDPKEAEGTLRISSEAEAEHVLRFVARLPFSDERWKPVRRDRPDSRP